MEEIKTVPIITTPVRSGATDSQTREYLVYYFFGALETLLVFRLILKIAGAGVNSWFVSIIYTLSRFFVMPFEGIFRRSTAQGVETTSVFEPSTIVALIVYALLAYGIVKLIRISSGEQQTGGE
ncbi:YggT family protein [Candidatus Dojkabacteria bacterium]|nr:YggT family protein [Candidatus Dojkabacteria bacterium]